MIDFTNYTTRENRLNTWILGMQWLDNDEIEITTLVRNHSTLITQILSTGSLRAKENWDMFITDDYNIKSMNTKLNSNTNMYPQMHNPRIYAFAVKKLGIVAFRLKPCFECVNLLTPGIRHEITALALAPREPIVVYNDGSALHAYDVESGENIAYYSDSGIKRYGDHVIHAIAVSDDNRVAVIDKRHTDEIRLYRLNTDDHTFDLYRTIDNGIIRGSESAGNIACMAWSPDGHSLAFVCNRKNVYLSMYTKGKDAIYFKGVTCCIFRGIDGIENIAWSPDGKILSISSYTNGITHFLLEDGSGFDTDEPEFYAYHHHKCFGRKLSWSPNSHKFLAYAQNIIRIFEYEDYEEFPEEKEPVGWLLDMKSMLPEEEL